MLNKNKLLMIVLVAISSLGISIASSEENIKEEPRKYFTVLSVEDPNFEFEFDNIWFKDNTLNAVSSPFRNTKYTWQLPTFSLSKTKLPERQRYLPFKKLSHTSKDGRYSAQVNPEDPRFINVTVNK